MIRVLIADDDEDLRDAIGGIVDDDPGMELIGVAVDAQQAIRLASTMQPDVAILDVNMPGGGSTAARGIKRGAPSTRILVLSGHGDRDTVMRMLEAGADGYHVKSSASIDALVDAIKSAAAGQGSLSAEVTRGVIQELSEELGERRRLADRDKRREARIQHVLDDGVLGMVFQPIVTLETRSAVGVEALSRFYGKPKRGPDKWFDEAAACGKLAKLELKAIKMALDALPDIPGDLYVSVNVSPSTLTGAAFRRLIESQDGSRIVIEVTEHAPIDDYPKTRAALDRLRAHGVRLAIDDTGAGFASLRHILRLSPDIIKLDRTLVSGIEADRNVQALAAGLITFAKHLGADIVAEGIERAEETATLQELGVTLGQGYAFAKPQPMPLRL